MKITQFLALFILRIIAEPIVCGSFEIESCMYFLPRVEHITHNYKIHILMQDRVCESVFYLMQAIHSDNQRCRMIIEMFMIRWKDLLQKRKLSLLNCLQCEFTIRGVIKKRSTLPRRCQFTQCC